MAKHNYTKEQDNLILSFNGSFTNKNINLFNSTFDIVLSRSSLAQRYKTLTRNDLKHKFMTFKRLEWVSENINKYKGEIFDIEGFTKAFNLEFNLNISASKLKYSLYNNGFTFGRSTKKPVNKNPIGFEKEFDGEWYVKVSDEKQKGNYHKFGYQRKARYMYEKYHNIKLNDNEYVIQLDGNKDNFNIDNLYLIDRKELGYMKNYWELNADEKKLAINVCKLKNILKMLEVKENGN